MLINILYLIIILLSVYIIYIIKYFESEEKEYLEKIEFYKNKIDRIYYFNIWEEVVYIFKWKLYNWIIKHSKFHYTYSYFVIENNWKLYKVDYCDVYKK